MRSVRVWLAAQAISVLMPAAALAGDLDPPGAPSSSFPTLGELAAAISSAEMAASTAAASAESAVIAAQMAEAAALGAGASAEAARIAAVAAQDPRTPIPSLPYVIDQPGSHYLTQDLTGTAASPGVVILANDVTLDLNGFALIGVPGSTDGIQIGEFGLFPTRIEIRNGAIHDWGGQGVEGDAAISWRMENVFATDNGGTGIEIGRIAPAGGSMVGCHAADNGGNGFRVGWSSVLRDCTSQGNSGIGMRLGARTTATGCVAQGNGNDGILMDFNNLLDGCVSSDNTSDGFGGLTAGNVLVNCTANNNTGSGIRTGEGSVVEGCTASMNAAHGIFVTRATLVKDNNCRGNDSDSMGGGAGIVASREENRIEGNTVTDNAVGIVADDTLSVGNLIVGNSAVGNGTNYTVDAGDNFLGTLQVTPVGAGPWDNFDL